MNQGKYKVILGTQITQSEAKGTKLGQSTADLRWVKHPSFPSRTLGRALEPHLGHPPPSSRQRELWAVPQKRLWMCPWKSSGGPALRQLFPAAGSTPRAACCSAGLNYSKAKAWKNHPQMGKTAAVGPFAKYSCLRFWQFTSKRLTFRMRKPQFHSLNPNHTQVPSAPTPDSAFIAGQTEEPAHVYSAQGSLDVPF